MRLEKIEARLEVAVTQEQFDKWDHNKQRQWLKDHPNSKFGKKDSKSVADKTRKPSNIQSYIDEYERAKLAYEKAFKVYSDWFDNMPADPTTKKFYSKPSPELEKLERLQAKFHKAAAAFKIAKRNLNKAKRTLK